MVIVLKHLKKVIEFYVILVDVVLLVDESEFRRRCKFFHLHIEQILDIVIELILFSLFLQHFQLLFQSLHVKNGLL